MRILLVILYNFIAFSVYSQIIRDSLIDGKPLLKIAKRELVSTSSDQIPVKNKDSFPRTTVHETYHEGRKIRVTTTYVSP